MTETASLVIKVDSSGAKRATADLDALAKQGVRTEAAAGRMSRGFGALGKTLATLGAGYAVGRFLGAVIRNTIEAEQVQAQLAARIKSTGQAAGLALGDLNAMAKALQRTSIYGDEAIGSAQALLLTFTKIGRETFPDALQAVLNMATAMGTDLNSAALQVGKALNSPVDGLGALSRAGVQFTDDQKAVIKSLVETGRQADAQKIILGELASQMGGAASAAADTLGGRISQLKEAFGDLLEGDTGSGGVKGVKVAVEDLTATMNDPAVQRGFQAIVSGIFSVSSEIIGGIGLMADYIRKYQDIAALGNGSQSIKGATDTALNDRLNALSVTQSRLKKGGVANAVAAVYGADSTIGFRDLFSRPETVIGRQQKEITAIIREITARNKRGLVADGVAAGFDFSASRISPPETQGGTSGAKAKASGGRSKAARAIPDFLPDIEETNRAVEAVTRARDAFDSMTATLSGPLDEALYRHQEAMREITDLGAKSEASSKDITNAKVLETKRYEEQRRELERAQDPMAQLLDSMAFELTLIGKSNAERAVMIELRRNNTDAMSAEAIASLDVARAYVEQERAQQTAIDLMDGFREGASNALTDIVTGAKSAKDALTDFFDSLAAQITRAIADNWIQKLFGATGSSDTGSAGDGIWSFLGSLMGGGTSSAAAAGGSSTMLDWMQGGYASGGYTGPGAMAQPAGIVHKGEVVWSQSDVARAGGVGAVEAMRRGGRSGGGVVQNVYVQGKPDKSTMKQLERASGRGAAREMSRTGR